MRVSSTILVSTSVQRTTSGSMGPSVTAVTSTSPERWCLPWGERTTQTALSAASASKEWVFLHVDLNVGRQIVKQTDWLSQAVKVIKSYLDSHSSCKSILGSSLSEISNKFRRRDQTKKKERIKSSLIITVGIEDRSGQVVWWLTRVARFSVLVLLVSADLWIVT